MKSIISAVCILSLSTAVSAACSKLVLDWGTYNPTFDGQTCKYSNVRFADPPLGALRFAAPQYPPDSTPPYPPPPPPQPGCIAMNETQCAPGSPPDTSACYPPNNSTQTEDCLYLDIYVPLAATTAQDPVPVVVWFYGGAYVFGSKTQYDFSSSDGLPLYDGSGFTTNWNYMVNSPFIFVAGNYRLGAFGWLAGSYMEDNAQPNAGLLDQRAILHFVHDHIGQLNGNNSEVTAWGESAGGSSLLHHLVMPENVKTPYFQRVLMQSPAYQFLWNRTGALNDTYTSFATQVAALEGCAQADITCLRNAHLDNLVTVNQILFNETACKGILPVGPAVDGNLVPDIPTNLFAKGSGYVANVNSVIVSHVDLEVPLPTDNTSFSFIPWPIRQAPNSEAAFYGFLHDYLDGDRYAPIRQNIEIQYPLSNFADQVSRAQQVIMDSSFLCNTRIVLDAYMSLSVPVYAMDYDFLGDLKKATHASDLIPTFANANSETQYDNFFTCLADSSFKGDIAASQIISVVGPGMKSYFLSHATSADGDPNSNVNTTSNYTQGETWSQATIDSNGEVNNLLQTGFWGFYNDKVDTQTSSATCDFWKQVALNISIAYHDGAGLRLPPWLDDQYVIEREL